MSVEKLVSEFVKEAPPYVVGADEQSKTMRPGVTRLLQLATNENPFGPHPMACEAMKEQALFPTVIPTCGRRRCAKNWLQSMA
jgi:histidinol-phosphate/aromatic aminotransferase/cobyric acid decarboxylase-like protein